MNIVVQTYDGRVQCRPDTSWEREDRDLFAPDFISAYDFVPVLFARICKAGKCVGGKFADRYYDAVNYGILLDAITVSGETIRIMDRTSVLPFPMYDRVTLENGDNIFSLRLDSGNGPREIWSTCAGSTSMVESAICNVSGYVSLRTGDIVAVCLSGGRHLISREESGTAAISGTFCGNMLFDFNIVM